MKHFIVFLFLIGLPSICLAQETIYCTITHDGLQREYILYVPASYAGDPRTNFDINGSEEIWNFLSRYDINGLTGIEPKDKSQIPATFLLSQNYPNPFNVSTMMKYNLPMNSEVTIELYDILGRKIGTLVDEVQPAGYYTTTWDANNVSSGIYFYKIVAGEFHETQKIMLVK